MLNKNANYNNIEKIFKYCTVLCMFSDHNTIFRMLSVYIFQLKCKQRQTNTTEKDLFFLLTLREVSLESKLFPTNRNRSAFLFHISKTFSNVKLFSNIFTKFFKTNFIQQNWNNFVEIISCFIYQLSDIAHIICLSI